MTDRGVRYVVRAMSPDAVRRARGHDGAKWRWAAFDGDREIDHGRTMWRWSASRVARRAIRRHLRAKRRYETVGATETIL